ncbi:MAG TPA: flavin reductase family protein [Acidimicrobiales bacterium]|nr:flavin reductase family protein [Acidimicrobiales bacterium]
MEPDDPFHQLVSELDYPMFIVTATAGERSGCLVGFASQASIEPPRFVVLLSKLNHTCGVAARADALAVHFLTRDDRELANLFGEETGDRIDKFARCRWEPGPFGTTVLPDTKGWIAGRVRERVDAGDHVVHLIDTEVTHLNRSGRPLSFQDVRDMKPGHPAS